MPAGRRGAVARAAARRAQGSVPVASRLFRAVLSPAVPAAISPACTGQPIEALGGICKPLRQAAPEEGEGAHLVTLLLGSGCRQCSMMGSGLLSCCAASSRDSACRKSWYHCSYFGMRVTCAAPPLPVTHHESPLCHRQDAVRSCPYGDLASQPALLAVWPVLRLHTPVQHKEGCCFSLLGQG